MISLCPLRRCYICKLGDIMCAVSLMRHWAKQPVSRGPSDWLPAGFRRIGFGRLISFLAVPVIHGTFSYPSQNTWLPDPLFSINTDNMHRSVHRPPHGRH